MSSARDAARVLVIDETDQILLIRGQDPSRPEIGSWWYAPGGGLEPGESHSEAAARELWEETGLRAVIDTDPIWQREVNFTFIVSAATTLAPPPKLMLAFASSNPAVMFSICIS